MNDPNAGACLIAGADLPDIFERMAAAFRRMEASGADIRQIQLYPPLRSASDRYVLEVEFNSIHDPENCQGCEYEREHPEFAAYKVEIRRIIEGARTFPMTVFWSAEDEEFVATFPDRQGLSARAKTRVEAIRQADIKLRGILEIERDEAKG